MSQLEPPAMKTCRKLQLLPSLCLTCVLTTCKSLLNGCGLIRLRGNPVPTYKTSCERNANPKRTALQRRRASLHSEGVIIRA